MPGIRDLSGEIYGQLTVLRFAGQNKQHVSLWVCRCSCGKEKVISSMGLRSGKTTSCGCHKAAVLAAGRSALHKAQTTHGASKTREHHIWQNILYRCNKPTASGYERYGGRGIKVCRRWQGKNGFINFLADMGKAPTREHTVDRIDNNGDYSARNCRWATRREQARNRRGNIVLEFRGERKLLCEWCDIKGLPLYVLSRRLRNGWSVERALVTPIRKRHRI